jgi:hypothetical protein
VSFKIRFWTWSFPTSVPMRTRPSLVSTYTGSYLGRSVSQFQSGNETRRSREGRHRNKNTAQTEIEKSKQEYMMCRQRLSLLHQRNIP